MTVERAIYYQKYVGLSADDKPVYNEDFILSLMPGAEFYETDTGDTYVWDGDVWKKKIVSAAGGGLTDTELRNTDVKVSLDGEVIATEGSQFDSITYLDGTDIYLCEAVPGSALNASVWRIQKIDSASDIRVEFASGAATFVNPATDLVTVKGLF